MIRFFSSVKLSSVRVICDAEFAATPGLLHRCETESRSIFLDEASASLFKTNLQVNILRRFGNMSPGGLDTICANNISHLLKKRWTTPLKSPIAAEIGASATI